MENGWNIVHQRFCHIMYYVYIMCPRYSHFIAVQVSKRTQLENVKHSRVIFRTIKSGILEKNIVVDAIVKMLLWLFTCKCYVIAK